MTRNYQSTLSTRKRKKIDATPFDGIKTPPRQNIFLLPLMWLICFFKTRKYRLKISKEGMKGIKPPFLVLGSHHSFMDFYVTPLALFPRRANYISELEGFECFGEWIYRQAGCLGTRKFISDFALVRNIQKVISRGDIMVIYPEARYSNVGTNSSLTLSIAKLAKLLNVPVVTLVMNGNHIQSPIWNLTPRKEARLSARLKCVLLPQQMKQMSAVQILGVLQKELTYDDYAYQRERKIAIKYKKRAEGLHMPLYQCRECGKEFCMDSKEEKLFCKNCGAVFSMDEYGMLSSSKKDGEPCTNAPKTLTIPEYYEWERECVKAQIQEGRYSFAQKVRVEALPNSKNFIALGKGFLVHKEEGFYLTFTEYMQENPKTLFFASRATPSVHTEYDYRGQGQCVTLSTLTCTYFLFPLEEEFNATKIQFAAEYFFERNCILG